MSHLTEENRKAITFLLAHGIRCIEIANVIGCDPATLSRDLVVLNKSYIINYVQPVDMFPRTYDVETVVSLKNKRCDEYVNKQNQLLKIKQ